MGTHLCFGEFPDQHWKSNWLNRYDDTYDCESWHNYGFEWTANHARWFLDGELVHEIEVSSLGESADQWPDEEMYIVLNNGQRTDSPDESTVWPNYLKVDFIRLYQLE